MRLPASGYPPADLSYFPDPVSRLVDEERRRQFMRERLHYESEYALLVQYTPPLRRKSKVADIIYDDDPAERVSPAGRILEAIRQGPCPHRGRNRRGRDAPADAELCRHRRLRSRAPA